MSLGSIYTWCHFWGEKALPGVVFDALVTLNGEISILFSQDATGIGISRSSLYP